MMDGGASSIARLAAQALFQFLVVVRQVVRHGHETKVRCDYAQRSMQN